MKILAPISLTTYHRLEHLKKTIESLQKNELAKDTILYIFSDAAKKGDEELVQKVRDYIHIIDGFKEVRIVEQETNNMKKNINNARSIPLKEFGKMIRMEDDNVVSPHFLQYMNDGLDFYKNDKKIFAICGFNVPVKYPNSYSYDYYISQYFNAWGFATWSDRGFFDVVNYGDQYNEMMGNKELYKKIKKVHPKFIKSLKLIQEGKLDAGDYKVLFHIIKNDMYCIKPIKSFVDNIGNDGSGVHCGINHKLSNLNLNDQDIKFTDHLKYNLSIDKIFYNFFHPKINIIRRILNKFKRIINSIK